MGAVGMTQQQLRTGAGKLSKLTAHGCSDALAPRTLNESPHIGAIACGRPSTNGDGCRPVRSSLDGRAWRPRRLPLEPRSCDGTATRDQEGEGEGGEWLSAQARVLRLTPTARLSHGDSRPHECFRGLGSSREAGPAAPGRQAFRLLSSCGLASRFVPVPTLQGSTEPRGGPAAGRVPA